MCVQVGAQQAAHHPKSLCSHAWAHSAAVVTLPLVARDAASSVTPRSSISSSSSQLLPLEPSPGFSQLLRPF